MGFVSTLLIVSIYFIKIWKWFKDTIGPNSYVRTLSHYVVCFWIWCQLSEKISSAMSSHDRSQKIIGNMKKKKKKSSQKDNWGKKKGLWNKFKFSRQHLWLYNNWWTRQTYIVRKFTSGYYKQMLRQYYVPFSLPY